MPGANIHCSQYVGGYVVAVVMAPCTGLMRIPVPVVQLWCGDALSATSCSEADYWPPLNPFRCKTRQFCSELVFNPDYPLGGALRLRDCWRPVCGHYCRLFVVHGTTMDNEQATKLSRNPPRHHLAS